MTMVSFRVAEDDAAAMQDWAERLGMDQSALLREALRRHLAWLGSAIDADRWEKAPPTEAEGALREVADWGPAEDWSDWASATR